MRKRQLDPKTEADVYTLAHDQPEFLLATILALMNKTGLTHITITSADVIAAASTGMLKVKSTDPSRLDIYLITQPGEQHVGLDYAEPYIADDGKRLQ